MTTFKQGAGVPSQAEAVICFPSSLCHVSQNSDRQPRTAWHTGFLGHVTHTCRDVTCEHGCVYTSAGAHISHISYVTYNWKERTQNHRNEASTADALGHTGRARCPSHCCRQGQLAVSALTNSPIAHQRESTVAD